MGFRAEQGQEGAKKSVIKNLNKNKTLDGKKRGKISCLEGMQKEDGELRPE